MNASLNSFSRNWFAGKFPAMPYGGRSAQIADTARMRISISELVNSLANEKCSITQLALHRRSVTLFVCGGMIVVSSGGFPHR
jgi:hypothetical protein